MAKYAIGLDYGTLSVRALLINIENGNEVGVSVYEYPHKVMEKVLPTGETLPLGWALQHPKDYMEGLIHTVTEVMKKSKVDPEQVVGIGVDFTASTVFPVRADGLPLCFMDEFAREPHAYSKLWKHHGAEEETLHIDKVVRERDEEWLVYCGGKISSEWMIPKVLETLKHAPKVYEKADRYIEAMDWLVWQLTGEETRSINGLRYKAFYNHKTGSASKEFYKALDERMENYIEEKMDAPQKGVGEVAGYLSESMAHTLGLKAGTPVGTPIIDAHACILGGGMTKPGEMSIIAGTSYAHYVFTEKETDVYGVCSIVKDGILPGYFAYEAGQSGGGDQFAWFVKNCIPEKYEIEAREKGINIHQLLVEKLNGYKAGDSGLIALDWFNGVRSPLADYNLNGLIMGMNLLTKPEDIYMALIEATGFGTRFIVEEFEKAGIEINSIVISGGIPLKNPMLVQVYSDILNREITVCQAEQSGSLGAAMLGIAAAPSEVTGYQCLTEIVEKLSKRGELSYKPNRENKEAYDNLFEEYKLLLEYFGKGSNDVMKRLNKLRKQ